MDWFGFLSVVILGAWLFVEHADDLGRAASEFTKAYEIGMSPPDSTP